jgi:hypothetical protein
MNKQMTSFFFLRKLQNNAVKSFLDGFLVTKTPWSRALLEKLIVVQLVTKFPAFYGNRSSLPPSPVYCWSLS